MKLIALIYGDEVIEKIATPLRSVAALRSARLPSGGSPEPEAVAAAGRTSGNLSHSS
jgi:hypothetical protein